MALEYRSVWLTDPEWQYGLDLGYRREMENRRAGRKHAYGAQAVNGLVMHRKGALDEVAGAKGLNVPYHETELGEPDLLHNIQIRGRSAHWQDLLVHEEILPNGKPGDSPRDRFVLVARAKGAREFRLHGWLWGAEAQLPRYWSDPARGRPAFFVPKKEIREIDTIFIARADRGFRIVAWDKSRGGGLSRRRHRKFPVGARPNAGEPGIGLGLVEGNLDNPVIIFDRDVGANAALASDEAKSAGLIGQCDREAGCGKCKHSEPS